MEEQEVLNVGDLLNGTIVNEINNVNEERGAIASLFYF